MHVCASVSSLLSQRAELAVAWEPCGLRLKKLLHCLSACHEPGGSLL